MEFLHANTMGRIAENSVIVIALVCNVYIECIFISPFEEQIDSNGYKYNLL